MEVKPCDGDGAANQNFHGFKKQDLFQPLPQLKRTINHYGRVTKALFII